jgi:hypothetical protein
MAIAAFGAPVAPGLTNPPSVASPPSPLAVYRSWMAYYIFNVKGGDASQTTQLLKTKMWAVRAGEPHRDALASGDLALVYLAAPKRVFVGRAVVASPVHDWTAAEAQVYPGDSQCGVSLARVEEWDPPVPMRTVLSQIDQSAGARADFEDDVVRITREEYVTALSVAADRVNPAD